MLTWNGDQFERELQRRLDAGGDNAARHLAALARRDAPVETGQGRGGIRADGDRVVIEGHLVWHEIGTRRMPARPNVTRKLRRELRDLALRMGGERR